MYSAMATTQSLADATQIAFNISSTVKVSLGSSQICEPPIEEAFSLQGTWSVKEICPESKASMINKMLITLVTEAGLNFSCILCSYKTWPVACSISTADSDSKFKGSELDESEFTGVLLGDHTYSASSAKTGI